MADVAHPPKDDEHADQARESTDHGGGDQGVAKELELEGLGDEAHRAATSSPT